jgi:hypothetical protein
VEVTADAGLMLKGGSQTAVKSDAMVEIKGSLVKIN